MRSTSWRLALALCCGFALLPILADAQTPPAAPAPAAPPSPTPAPTAAPAGGSAELLGKPMTGFALFGVPALPPDFKNFPYVNPDAPKGGEIVLSATGSFDNFNPFILRGHAAAESARVYDTLLRESANEPSTGYAHLAESMEIAPDRLSVAYNLRPEAKFQDGVPVTADDVVWTFNTLKSAGRPNYRQYYADVIDATVEGPRRVVFHFRNADSRELPLIVGEMPILPKHWWAGRDFTAPLTEAPLGSGPYRVDHFEMGRTTVLARVPDYWAKDLPTARGLNNFGTVRTEYFRDSTVAMEAFKSGQIQYRNENVSKNWATAYDFPAVQQGLVIKESFRHHLPTGMQSFAMNSRRAVFAERRVREAIAQVFDFQWMNKNLFYGLYTRTDSYFSNSDLASSGLPQGDELTLLSQYRDKLPAELFTQPFTLPVTDGSGNNREGLRRALNLLKDSGWEIKERKLVNKDGQQMSFEILSNDPTYERIETPYVQWLARLGIDARVRTVDPAQYQHRLDSFDFDMTMAVFPESDFPGNEQRDFWTCQSAKTEGSSNEMGVCDPVVDALVDTVIASPDKAHLITNTRALDRVLLWGWYGVPNWHYQYFNVAHWNRFGHPDVPVRSGNVFDAWWVDPKLAAANDAARSAGGL
jgi:microcin C transport system substrate-binding protein